MVDKSHFLPTINITDSRSLFEQAGTYTMGADKRLRVDMSSIRESIQNDEIRIEWIEKEKMMADALTKYGASKEVLMANLRTGSIP